MIAITFPAAARADIMPSAAKSVGYTYEIDNVADHPETTFVVWPRACDSGGEPHGTVHYVDEKQSLAHTIDYEVLEPGPRQLLRYCAGTARVYALDAKAFPTDTRVAPDDDWILGWKKGQRYAAVRALDAMTLRERVPFFAKARKADFAFPYVAILRRTSPIASVHDVFTVRALDDARFEIAPVRVRYELVRGAREEIAWTAGERPPPRTGGARALEVPKLGLFDSDRDGDDDAREDADVADAGAAPVALAPASGTGAAARLPWRSVLASVVVVVLAIVAVRRLRRS